eukprot:9995913-Heterocapsa_arctica.AAC.1
MDRSLACGKENTEHRRGQTREIGRGGHPRTIIKSTLVSDHRLIGASIGWGRKKTLHVMCMYGLDTGQVNPGPEEGNRVLRDRVAEHLAKLGRVPWIIGGDWNVEPGTFTLEHHNGKAAYVATTGHTYSRDG